MPPDLDQNCFLGLIWAQQDKGQIFFLSANFYVKSTFSKIFSGISVSNSLDSGQARQFVGPDLRPNCLQRLNYQQTILAGYRYWQVIGTGEEFTNSCDECVNPY